MGRRYDHSRPEIREMAFVAAQRLAELEGYPGMTARAIAERIGYTAGTLYLVYENLDELIDRVTTEVLRRQLDALQAAMNENDADADKFRAVVDAYCTFATNYPKQWMLPFQHERKRTTRLPERLVELKREIYDLFATSLRPLLLSYEKAEIETMTVALWSGICGATVLLLEQGLAGRSPRDPIELSRCLIAPVLRHSTAPEVPDES